MVYNLALEKSKIQDQIMLTLDKGFQKLEKGEKTDMKETYVSLRNKMLNIQKQIDGIVFEEDSIPQNQVKFF